MVNISLQIYIYYREVYIMFLLFVVDLQKSSEVFLRGLCYIFCTSTKITLKTPIQHLSRARSRQQKIQSNQLTFLRNNKYYELMCRRIAFWKFGFFNGDDTALDTRTQSTRNQPKTHQINMSTVGLTRQWISTCCIR